MADMIEADDEICELVDRVMHEFHGRLVAADPDECFAEEED